MLCHFLLFAQMSQADIRISDEGDESAECRLIITGTSAAIQAARKMIKKRWVVLSPSYYYAWQLGQYWREALELVSRKTAHRTTDFVGTSIVEFLSDHISGQPRVCIVPIRHQIPHPTLLPFLNESTNSCQTFVLNEISITWGILFMLSERTSNPIDEDSEIALNCELMRAMHSGYRWMANTVLSILQRGLMDPAIAQVPGRLTTLKNDERGCQRIHAANVPYGHPLSGNIVWLFPFVSMQLMPS